jgi:L-2-hydroxyglutarate oxidase LhgO
MSTRPFATPTPTAAVADIGLAIVGGGIVGMACAARLARSGHDVVVIERHAQFGQECSSRNSGVIHAGLYYEPSSLKALTCVEGRDRLYARCAREGLPHRKCGKLVVATDAAERSQLEALCARGLTNQAGPLRVLEPSELRRLEPRVRAVAALWSELSGIVDVHALLESYRREALRHGAALSRATELVSIEPCPAGLRLTTRSARGDRLTLTAARVVNAAGLGAEAVARAAGLDTEQLGYRLRPCKGDYFTIAPRLRGIVTHLVYPVPAQAGLGVHITFDLAGELRAGPDAEYVDELSYDVDPAKAAGFGAALRRYLPELRDDDLSPDYAGIRPKLQGPGQSARDFVIEEASRHGAPGLVNLIGIESPGITASEAIAERVAALLRG